MNSIYSSTWPWISMNQEIFQDFDLKSLPGRRRSKRRESDPFRGASPLRSLTLLIAVDDDAAGRICSPSSTTVANKKQLCFPPFLRTSTPLNMFSVGSDGVRRHKCSCFRHIQRANSSRPWSSSPVDGLPSQRKDHGFTPRCRQVGVA